MGITKGVIKAGRILGAILIGAGAGFIWYSQSTADPIYYPIGIGIIVALIAYVFLAEKSISGGLANSLRSLVMAVFGAFLGYMWYSQYKDIQQALIVGVVSIVLLVLLSRKAFKGGKDE